jgi:osmotically-inducible protein OsmY
MEFNDGIMTLHGEVANIAAKRLTLELAAALPQVSGVVDRLHVAPAEAMGDGAIADHFKKALLTDSSFNECAISARVRSEMQSIRTLTEERRRGWIEVQVDNGLVTLNGEVPSLSHKRLAGVYAWWIPGSRDVINGIAVEPIQQDHAAEVIDAVRLALEKDTFVNAAQIRIDCQQYVVTLSGLVTSDAEREMAEFDTWAVFGVDDVINRIEV